jgi:Ala-tRNA(Pro) deacylase
VDTHAKLIALLDGRGVAYRLVEHAAEGRSARVSAIRGNNPSQALKALVVVVRGGGRGRRTVLAVVPGNRALDMKGLLAALGAQKGRFAPPEEAAAITGCVMGAVPPFSFDPDLPVIADAAIRDNDEVVFNAGLLGRSLYMAMTDYVAIVGPLFADIAAAAPVS